MIIIDTFYDNREISFDDIINISKTRYFFNKPKNNYFIMWKNKNLFLESYINDYKLDDYDFNYYNGLSYNALNIIKNLNFLNLSYGLSYIRFYNINTLYDLNNPYNIEYSPLVNSFAEYIKYMFFYKKKRVEYNKIFQINLNNEDYYFFVARLIYPTYYYDLFKDDRIKTDYKIIESMILDYISYIKEIIKDIKKRHINMSLLDSVISQL